MKFVINIITQYFSFSNKNATVYFKTVAQVKYIKFNNHTEKGYNNLVIIIPNFIIYSTITIYDFAICSV